MISLSKEDLYKKLVGRKVIVRKYGRGIHLYLDCQMVQDNIDDKYYVTVLKKGMKNKGLSKSVRDVKKEYVICIFCYDIYKHTCEMR